MFGGNKKLNLEIQHENSKNNANVDNWGQKKFDPVRQTQAVKESFNRFKAHLGRRDNHQGNNKQGMGPNRRDGHNNNKFNQGGQRHKEGNNKFNNGGQRHKKGNNKFNNGGHRDKVQNNTFKPNPFRSNTPQDIRTEAATPWVKFKDDLNNLRREEEHASRQSNFDTEEGKKFLKEREKNYRKMLMEEKKKEPTQWEDFDEEKTHGSEVGKVAQLKNKNKKAKNKVTDQQPVCPPQKDNQQIEDGNVKQKKNKKNKNKGKDGQTMCPTEKMTDSSQDLGLNVENKDVAATKIVENVPQKGKRKRKNNETALECPPEKEIKVMNAQDMTFEEKDRIRRLLTKANMARKGNVIDTILHYKWIKRNMTKSSK
ncbi:uncharacterized protein DDB_G0287625 [Musca domestica]|uniref:Uncharacterized protein DDB_G0287625 n=1 Tax=Musca domestica TaxID=7370 RepID=A0A9J7CWJ7_MUSDO|nr:uncharacterized protein DDB_G0287625 [Musca domestica]